MKRRLTAVLMAVCAVLALVPWAAADSAPVPKLVALTFDDGPGPYTETLLDGLAERGMQATFFCVGSSAERYPALLKRMVEEGHQLSNHSYSHPNLNTLGLESAVYQMTRTDTILNEATGGSGAHYYRAPYGNSTEALRSRLEAPLIYWSVDTEDWKVLNADKVKANILRDVYDGAIILCHDIYSTTVKGALAAIDALQEQGYEFVTVKELFRRRGVTPSAGVQYYSCKPTGTDLPALAAPELSMVNGAGAVEVTLQSRDSAPVYYTLDGSAVTYGSSCYDGPFTVQLPCTIRAVAALDLNGARSAEAVWTLTLPPAGEPELRVEDGQLILTPAAEDETVYYALGDADVLAQGTAWTGPVDLTPGTWFSYYAGGPERMNTPVRRLLYTAEGNLFADVDPALWYYPVLDQAAARGYLQGTGSWRMSPESEVTRGMLAVLLYRFSGEENPGGAARFTDVDPGAYYAEAVAWGAGAGVLNGTGADTFAPDRPVTRQELARVLLNYVRYLGAALPEGQTAVYSDGDTIASWAAEAVQAVTALGIMEGGNGSFRPLGTATRAEVAAVLLRLEKLAV